MDYKWDKAPIYMMSSPLLSKEGKERHLKTDGCGVPNSKIKIFAFLFLNLAYIRLSILYEVLRNWNRLTFIILLSCVCKLYYKKIFILPFIFLHVFFYIFQLEILFPLYHNLEIKYCRAMIRQPSPVAAYHSVIVKAHGVTNSTMTTLPCSTPSQLL